MMSFCRKNTPMQFHSKREGGFLNVNLLRMVKSHPCRHLVAVIACFSLLTLHSDGANLYGPPRQLDIDRHLEAPGHEDTFTLKRLSDLAGGGGGSNINWDDTERGQEADALNTNTLSNSHLQTIGRPPPSSYVPDRYFMVPPEENFLQELLRHSPTSSELRGNYAAPRQTGALYGSNLPRNIAEQLELKLPAVDSARDSDWVYPENVKVKRFYPRLTQDMQVGQTRPHYMQADTLQEPRVVATKRFWGNYRRQKGQMDRRASQSKHYDCLKSCIKEGKLHPIQCHTLC